MFRHDRVKAWNILDVSLIRSYLLLQQLLTVRVTLQGMCLIGSYGFGPFPGNPLMSVLPATRLPFPFACGLEIRWCHAGRGSLTR